jgi:leucyl aminopeptidase
VKRVALIGTGATDELDAEGLRRFGGVAGSEARDREAARLLLWARRGRGMEPGEAAAAIAEGAVLGAYRYDRHQAAARKRGSKRPAPTSATIVFDEVDGLASVRKEVAEAVVGAVSQTHARDLSNAPPNEMSPAAMASAARAIAREAGLRCQVLRPAELEKRGFGALLAVGSGSAHPPCLIVLEHTPGRGGKKGSKAPVCLVGKGITFDSGGLSLKPAVPMLDMKHDISGAATVLATMRAVGLLDWPDHVVGVVAAAENMPSGTAYRPSDILTSRAGKTIEVVNTDAEGRLVLADALDFAIETYSPRVLVDVATLTGAAMMAFGPWATAALGNDDRVIDGLRAAGERSGERIWPMPLLREHRQAIKSSVADIKNTGGPSAGASTAAAFLGEFVSDTPWTHLDIAGTGWSSNRSAYHRGGATGVGVRTLLAWLRDGVQRFA